MPGTFAGRARRRLTLLLVPVIAAACSTGSPGSTSAATSGSGATTTSGAPKVGSTTLRVAFLEDMGPPDPDTFYATEGLTVTTSAYEGLLQYANNSTMIVPALIGPAHGIGRWPHLHLQAPERRDLP